MGLNTEAKIAWGKPALDLKTQRQTRASVGIGRSAAKLREEGFIWPNGKDEEAADGRCKGPANVRIASEKSSLESRCCGVFS